MKKTWLALLLILTLLAAGLPALAQGEEAGGLAPLTNALGAGRQITGSISLTLDVAQGEIVDPAILQAVYDTLRIFQIDYTLTQQADYAALHYAVKLRNESLLDGAFVFGPDSLDVLISLLPNTVIRLPYEDMTQLIMESYGLDSLAQGSGSPGIRTVSSQAMEDFATGMQQGYVQGLMVFLSEDDAQALIEAIDKYPGMMLEWVEILLSTREDMVVFDDTPVAATDSRDAVSETLTLTIMPEDIHLLAGLLLDSLAHDAQLNELLARTFNSANQQNDPYGYTYEITSEDIQELWQEGLEELDEATPKAEPITVVASAGENGELAGLDANFKGLYEDDGLLDANWLHDRKEDDTTLRYFGQGDLMIDPDTTYGPSQFRLSYEFSRAYESDGSYRYLASIIGEAEDEALSRAQLGMSADYVRIPMDTGAQSDGTVTFEVNAFDAGAQLGHADINAGFSRQLTVHSQNDYEAATSLFAGLTYLDYNDVDDNVEARMTLSVTAKSIPFSAPELGDSFTAYNAFELTDTEMQQIAMSAQNNAMSLITRVSSLLPQNMLELLMDSGMDY